MDSIGSYITLLGIIAAVGVLFNKSTAPISLLLVITGMVLSFIPHFPHNIRLDPYLVLNVFLPLLVYRASAESSWRDVKINLRPIASLSIGHVLFITLLVAITGHSLIPQLNWPLAFLLGAVISPPDAVAIIAIAEKIYMPRRIITILQGEALLNDAMALIVFRFALAAVITHEFSAIHALSDFFMIVVCETLYGLLLGRVIGELRLKVNDSMLQMLISLLTPFIAYLPAARLGGSGVLATVVTGMVIGHFYIERFPPEVRLYVRSAWKMLEFIVVSILFLLIGLDMRFIVIRISSIPLESLALYSLAIIFVVIVGRFIWIYCFYYLPAKLYKKNSRFPWQYPFVVSWSGMRGGVSLAAALAVPTLPTMIDGANTRDLLVFLVFCVITATLLIQGLTLPWLLKALGVNTRGEREKYTEHLTELKARVNIIKTALDWLVQYKESIKDRPILLDEVTLLIKKYKTSKKQLTEGIKNHDGDLTHHEDKELKEVFEIRSQVMEVERKTLLQLWHKDQISYAIKNKLLEQLDHRSKNL